MSEAKTQTKAAIFLLTDKIFEEKQVEKLYLTLTNKWDRYQSLSAAIKLMQQHEVEVDEEERARLATLDERQMIEALVQKMPNKSKEQFQQFFYQLQIIVSTATRVRQALEAGQPDLVQQALDDADSRGMSSYILKMAVVSAGYEVIMQKRLHEDWVKDAETRMSRLVRGQEDSMKARKRLATAQAKLAELKGSNDNKTKNVLMKLAGGNDTAIKAGTLKAWRDYTKQMQEEREIYKEFEERIEQVETQLAAFKTKHLKNISGVVNRKYAATLDDLKREVFAMLKEEMANQKFFRENEALINDLEGKIKEATEAQGQVIQKIMMKMFGDSEAVVMKFAWQAWMAYHSDYGKNKELEDSVRMVEGRLKDKMKGKAGEAQSVLNKMSQATDAGLVHMCFSSWRAYWKEAKEEAEMAAKLEQFGLKTGAFGSRNKNNAHSAMERAREHGDTMLCMTVFFKWLIDARMEALMKRHFVHIEGKKVQLQKVQTMFREFAGKLEMGIKSGGDTDRDIREAARQQKPKRMSKGEGSVSLPDIHKSGVSPKAQMRGPPQGTAGSGRRQEGTYAYPQNQPGRW